MFLKRFLRFYFMFTERKIARVFISKLLSAFITHALNNIFPRFILKKNEKMIYCIGNKLSEGNMPLGSALNSVRLLTMNLNTNKTTRSFVKKPHVDKPLIFPENGEINFLNRVSPEKYGYDEKYVNAFFNELYSDLSVRANRVLILKGNEVIGERYSYPYVKDAWDCVFSATKTVTALALGALYDEGKVDIHVPVCKILGMENNVGNLANKKITLKHLLTMSTGNTFNELESAVSLKWVKGFFDSGNKFPIGKKFEYNSLNTFMIGACIEKITGKHLSDYVQEKIFDPLGIKNTYFERSPEGIAKSGWGLYILPEDMAKLGILMRDYGLYGDKRVISEEWIKEMSSLKYHATKFGHRFDYGYQMWVKEEDNFCCFNGMYNQDILIYRNTGVVIVMCCANNEAFHGSNLYNIAAKYFAYQEKTTDLCETHGTRDYKNDESLSYYYDKIANKPYVAVKKIANSCGVLPLLLQNEMGTYVKGVKEMTFKKDNGYSLVIKENDEDVEIKFDFDNGIRQTFDFYGNLYDCVADGRFILSGKGEPYLIIRVFFLEFASSRYFSIRFGKNLDVLSVEASENPGLEFIQALLETQDKATRNLINGAMRILNPDVVAAKAKNIFSPTMVLEYKKPEKTE